MGPRPSEIWRKMRLFAKLRRFSLDDFLDNFIPPEIRVQPDWHRRARMFMLSHVFGPFLGNVIPLYLYLVGMKTDYRFWVFAGSVTVFWAYPFLLKWTERYKLLAFVSVQNLLFCILWACYSYGGIYSPFLPWLLITPTLAFFYLPSTGLFRDALLALIAVNVLSFAALVLGGYPFPPVDLEMFQVIGIISTISASVYVAMMSLYFARGPEGAATVRARGRRSARHHREFGEPDRRRGAGQRRKGRLHRQHEP